MLQLLPQYQVMLSNCSVSFAISRGKQIAFQQALRRTFSLRGVLKEYPLGGRRGFEIFEIFSLF